MIIMHIIQNQMIIMHWYIIRYYYLCDDLRRLGLVHSFSLIQKPFEFKRSGWKKQWLYLKYG